MSSNTASRFTMLELLRIVIPGMYFMFLVLILIVAFELPLFLLESSGMMLTAYLVASFVSGLSIYSNETSKKRKAFQLNQPSLYILERSRQMHGSRMLTEDEARRLYYYILNQEIPPSIHDKIFYFGMIYHIMVNIRRTSFWFGLTGFIGLLIQIVTTRYMTPLSMITVLLIWVVYFLNVRYNKADRKMQENYHDQIFWLEMNSDLVDRIILQRTNISRNNE